MIRTTSLNHNIGDIISRMGALYQALSLHILCHEPTAKGISRAIGVDNVLCVDRNDGNSCDFPFLCDNRWQGPVGKDDDAGTRRVLFGESSNVERNLSNVTALDVVNLGIGESLGFVSWGIKEILRGKHTKQHIPVFSERVDRILEELGDEWSRQVHGKVLVLFSRVLGNLELRIIMRGQCSAAYRGIRRNGQKVAAHVKELGGFHARPDFRRLQVCDLVLVCRFPGWGEGGRENKK